MIDVVSTGRFTTYLELRPVGSLEKCQREFSGILAEFIHYAETVDYVMKSRDQPWRYTYFGA